MKYITNALLAVIVALLINFVLVRIRGRKIKASKKELLAATLIGLAVSGATINLLSTKKMYSPRDTGSGSSGGSSGGGGGGGGGGGFSGGGGGGHSF
jgi:uncharacterized protein